MIKIVKIVDTSVSNFLNIETAVIKEVNKNEFNNITNNNTSYIFFEDTLNMNNERLIMKNKNNYIDIYTGREYKAKGLIYIDDKKRIYICIE